MSAELAASAESRLAACSGCDHYDEQSGGCPVIEAVSAAAKIGDDRDREIVNRVLTIGENPVRRAALLPPLKDGETLPSLQQRFSEVMDMLRRLPLIKGAIRSQRTPNGAEYRIDTSVLRDVCESAQVSPSEQRDPEVQVPTQEETTVVFAVDEDTLRVHHARLELIDLVRDWVLCKHVNANRAKALLSVVPPSELGDIVAQGKYYAFHDEDYQAKAGASKRLELMGRYESNPKKGEDEEAGSRGARVMERIIGHIEVYQDGTRSVREDASPEQTEGNHGAWQDFANCLGVEPDLFFPERGASTRESKEVCKGCVVREECLEYALARGEKFGIWGGLSERERRRIRRQRALALRAAKTAQESAVAD